MGMKCILIDWRLGYLSTTKYVSLLIITNKSDDNKPLMIVAPESVSQKHFLIEWFNHHEKNRIKVVVIFLFN